MKQPSTENRQPIEKGSVLLEFTFVSGLLLLLISGIVDYSNALYEQSILLDASWVGARASELDVVQWSSQVDEEKKADEDYQRLVERYREGIEVARVYIASNSLSPDSYRYKMISRLTQDVASGITTSEIRLVISNRDDISRFLLFPRYSFKSCVGSSVRVLQGVRNLVFDGLTISVNGFDEHCNP